MKSIISTQKPETQDQQIRLLFVKWNEDVIGILAKRDDVGYMFKYYGEGIRKAKANGFPYLIGFRDLRKVYVSKELFQAFKSRIPSKQRRDIQNKLNDIGLSEYDEFNYLANSEGRLLTDAISFEEATPEQIRCKNNKSLKPHFNEKAISER